MRKSLIDSIGRGTASKLMEDAVLQAVEESHKLGPANNTKAAQSLGDQSCQIESGRKIFLSAGGVEHSAFRSLIKQAPIA